MQSMTGWGAAVAAVALGLPGPRASGDETPPPRLEGLGTHTRPITTNRADVQRCFDQGLVLLFAFNHDEASRSFRYAAALDPSCAMAYWGIALAQGPHINHPTLPPDRARAAWSALTEARRHAAGGTAVEQALIEALGARYAEPAPEERSTLDRAYAEAMKRVWSRFPNDPDVGALYAEALMDLRPWDLWSSRGEPRPETPEILETLEAVLKLSPAHPLGLHLYIHAVEASPTPGKADEAADRLRTAVPGLGHLVHMPSHIDVRRGRWQTAIEANQRALEADRRYAALVPRQGFYRIYMTHNHHMLAFAAMMQGEFGRSLAAVRTMLAAIPADWLRVPENAAFADGLFAAPVKVLMRFGRWDELLAEPEPAATFPVARALWWSARGVAYTAQGRLDDARAAQQAFRAAVQSVPDKAFFGNNAAADVLAVADGMLAGELLLREGKTQEGLDALRAAVVREDALRYDEPPDWIQPVRHALGAALLKAGRPVEAEQVYREDLQRWPHNGWSLFGLAESLAAQGQDAAAAEARAAFQRAWSRADVTLHSSCFCQ